MKVLTASQIRALDQYTIQNEPIRSIDLMERASKAFVDRLVECYPDQKSFYILCGKGNNGGDGLAAARLIDELGFSVQVAIIEHSSSASEDHITNLNRLKKRQGVEVISVSRSDELPVSNSNDLVVDAILGSGLDRPLKGMIQEVVHLVNQWNNQLVSIDIPTGLYSEFNEDNDRNSVMQADRVISFHAPKLSFLLADNAPFVPEFDVVDIGLLKGGEPDTNWFFIDQSEIEELIKPRLKFSHKGTYGHALILAGSLGKIGAAILCGKAALRSGCGLVTVRSPKCGLNPLQVSFPEAMCWPDVTETHLTEQVKIAGFSSVAVGPGIGTNEETQVVLKALIQNANCPLVLDADALNIISENKTWLQFLPPNTILTPHPKEFDRLTENHESAETRLKSQLELARKTNCIVILKGAHTSVACPDGQLIFNSTGNPGMATAGSGDVLTGIIAGLLAQGYHPKHAAIIGVYQHGAAGDQAAIVKGESALIAGDIIDAL